MLRRLLLVIFIVVAGILGFAATKPNSFAVTRAVTIKAPPAKIYALVANFHQWQEWSPWEKLDPTMRRTFGGPDVGKGATYAWEGNGKAGAGRMEIVQAQDAASVDIQLDFIKPIEGRNRTVFKLEPQSGQTRVVWTMEGPTPFISKVVSVFVSMDQLIGRDFEAGLNNLKTAAEKP